MTLNSNNSTDLVHNHSPSPLLSVAATTTAIVAGGYGDASNSFVENTSIDDNRTFLKRDVIISLLAGGCAGALAKTVIAPLDRTKIMFQVSKTPFTYAKAIENLSKSYVAYGLRSWWRGNSATMARIIPYAAIQFTAHEQIKKLLGSVKNEALPPFKRLLAGSLAGSTAVILTYPLDMVRARMAVSGITKYKSLRHTFLTVYKEEGIRTFYNGFIPTIVGIMPYAGVSFFIYESLKKHYYNKNNNQELLIHYRLFCGAIAGACGQTFTYPMDIVRRRMQTDGIDGKGYIYRNLLWTLSYVFKTEGFFKGFYKGLSINWIKGPIAVGISFATYDTAKSFMNILLDQADETKKCL